MKAFASDKTVRLGAEGLVLWAEIHNEGDVNVAVLKCHGGDHSPPGAGLGLGRASRLGAGCPSATLSGVRAGLLFQLGKMDLEVGR